MMNEAVNEVAPDGTLGVAAQGSLTAGAILRNAREAAGLHVAALAVSMKVSVKKLEALEADRLDLLPDAVFVRALASSVCRALKIDAAPVLERLPQTAVPRLDAEERGINTPFHAAGQSVSYSVPGFFAKPSVLTVLVLLVGAAVVVLYPEGSRIERVAEPEPATPALVALPAAAPVVAMEVPAAAMTATPPIPVAPVQSVVPAPEVTVAAAGVAAKSAASAPATIPMTVTAAPELTGVTSAPDASAGSVLALKAHGSSWVEVTDARGVVQLRRTLFNGDVPAVSGTLPLSVVIGRADAVDVLVRGKPLDMTGLVRENVARFEVK
jgi:cytoskeleton protein RodZ